MGMNLLRTADFGVSGFEMGMPGVAGQILQTEAGINPHGLYVYQDVPEGGGGGKAVVEPANAPVTLPFSAPSEAISVLPDSKLVPAGLFRRSAAVKGAYITAQTALSTSWGLVGAAVLNHFLDTRFFESAAGLATMGGLGAVLGLGIATRNLRTLSHERESELPVKPLGADKIFSTLGAAGVLGLIGAGLVYAFTSGSPEAYALSVGLFSSFGLSRGLLSGLASIRNSHVDDDGEIRKNRKLPADTPREVVTLLRGYDKLSFTEEQVAQIERLAQYKHTAVVGKMHGIALAFGGFSEPKQAAIRALAQIGTEEAYQALLEISQNATWDEEKKLALELWDQRPRG